MKYIVELQQANSSKKVVYSWSNKKEMLEKINQFLTVYENCVNQIHITIRTEEPKND